MAEPIIFTLLLGNNDQILEKIRNHQEAQNPPAIVVLQTNKESHIPDKDRIFAEILEQSTRQNKVPIFNIQLNNNDTKPIFKLQDITNLQNLNIKITITFDRYNSLAENPELADYWKQILTKVDRVFFADKQGQELAISENLLNKDKTTIVKDTEIDSLISVFNNLADDQKVNKLLSDVIPDKVKLDKIIKIAKNQNGRVIVKTWPISADEATNLITAKFGITSEDQIYGLKLEITEILKDQANAAQNLQKYVSQISQQFQKDLGKSEINPIDFNFDREKIMKNIPDNLVKEPITTSEPLKENQPKQPGFFRKVFNYLRDIATDFKEAIFGKKENSNIQTQETPQAPPQQTKQKEPEPWEQLGMPERVYEEMMYGPRDTNINNRQLQDVTEQDIANVKKPEYWYHEYEITSLLKESVDLNKVSVQSGISLRNSASSETINTDVLNNAVKDIKENGKESAVIPIEMGYGHWCGLFMTYNKESDQVYINFNDSLGNSINNNDKILPNLIDKALGDLSNKPVIIDEQTKQQTNQSDCGVFTVDNLVRLANGKQILTTKEAENKGQELRNQHAGILTRIIAKQQVQEIGQHERDTQPNNKQFQNLVKSQKTNSTSRTL